MSEVQKTFTDLAALIITYEEGRNLAWDGIRIQGNEKYHIFRQMDGRGRMLMSHDPYLVSIDALEGYYEGYCMSRVEGCGGVWRVVVRI
jgi:hypothetical protein